MTLLKDPEDRRGLRSIIQAIIALIVVALVGWIIHLLRHEADPLLQIALALLVIVAMGTFFYGAENVTRAVRFKASAAGIEGEIGDDEKAQAVATAAQDKADEVST